MKKILTEAKGYGVVQRDFMTMPISIYAKAVYTLLRTYSGEKHSCYPSLKTICDDLRVSKSTVLRAIKELEEISMVAVRRSKKSGSNENAVNTYLPLSVMIEIDMENLDLNNEEDGLGGVSQIPRGVCGVPRVVSEVDSKNNNIKNNKEDNISVVKKSKKEFIKPTLSEVIEFFKTKGLNSDLANKAYTHYDMAEWKDSRGNKVVNWKQKMNTNWISNNLDNPKYKAIDDSLFGSSNQNESPGWGNAQDSRMVM